MIIEINIFLCKQLISMIIMGCPGGKINMAAVSAKQSMNGGVFCHVTHDVISSDWQPCLFSKNLKPSFKQKKDISSRIAPHKSPRFFEYFGILVRGPVRPPCHFKAEEAMGTRMILFIKDSHEF